MTVIEHGSDTVEAETVEVEFVQPILAVGEQEVYHLVFAVVETERVPGRMLVAVAGIEELVGVAGQIAQSLHLVFHGMGVYDVHNHGHALSVRFVNQLLEFFGRSEAT